MATLLDSWRRTVAAVGGDPSPSAGSNLLARWSEPHRRYHTLDHLAAVLSVVDDNAEQAAAPDAVRLAAWFHDAIYDPRTARNETDSAQLAAEVLGRLGVPAAVTAEVARLVLVTADHQPDDGDADAALLCDADLAVLAASRTEYQEYAAAVRDEYAFVSDDAFRKGRAAVLREFLGRSQIYQISILRARWEKSARANLEHEVSILDARTTEDDSDDP